MDDYEFKAMLSELSIVERGSTLAEVVRRKTAVIIGRLAHQPQARQFALPAERAWGQGRNVIYIIGDWLDPTAGPRGRLWWLFAFAIYGLWAASAVSLGAWNFGQMVLGFGWMLTAFIGAVVIGVLIEINRSLGSGWRRA